MKLNLNTKKRSILAMTLTEVVVASAIVAIGGAALLKSFAFTFMVTNYTRQNQRATQIMLEKTETIRLYSWDQVNKPGFIPTTFTDVYDPQDTNNPGVTYNGTVTIGPYPGSASYSRFMRQLTITLNWMCDKRPMTRTMSTFISRDGIQNYVY